MTIGKSDKELLNSAAPWDLTEDELERKCELERLIQDGYYEPGQITVIDVEDCMRKWGLIPDEFTGSHFCPTQEDKDILHKILLKNWNSLSELDKVIYHWINRTLPRWGEPRPPSEAFIKYYNEQIDKP